MDTFWATPSFDDWPIEKWHEVLKDLSENGFSGIEPLISNPFMVDIEDIKKLLDEYNLRIFGFRTGGIALEHDVFFNHADLSKRKEAAERFIDIIHYAAQFGNPDLLVGLIQGNLQDDQSLDEAEDNVRVALHECARVASQYGMEIGLEPVNRFEIDHHNTLESVSKFLNSINSGNIYILVDTYHMKIEEGDIAKSIRDAADMIGHVHLADSNRKVPGKGDFDFDNFFKTLRKIDYRGCMTIEALTDSTQSEITHTMRFLEQTPNFMEE